MPSPADLLGGPPHQDYIVLGGMPSPGLAVVRGAGSPRNWDIQKGWGLTGAASIFTGEDLAKFDVDIFAWEPEHFAAWQAFSKLVLMNPPIGTRPLSISIQHPMLNDSPLSITQVVVTNVTQWDQGPDGDGLFARTISLLQYRKPRMALVKPDQAPPGSPVVVERPVDPEVLLIQKKSATIAGLAK